MFVIISNYAPKLLQTPALRSQASQGQRPPAGLRGRTGELPGEAGRYCVVARVEGEGTYVGGEGGGGEEGTGAATTGERIASEGGIILAEQFETYGGWFREHFFFFSDAERVGIKNS